MLPLLSVLCPPLAVSLTGSRIEVMKNLALTSLLYIPGVLHARGIVERYTVGKQYDNLFDILEHRAIARRAA